MTESTVPLSPVDEPTAAPPAQSDALSFAMEQLAMVRGQRAHLAAADRYFAELQTDLEVVIKTEMVAGGLTRKRWAGLEAAVTWRNDMTIDDLDQALAHLADLNRLDEVMVTKPERAKILSIARKLEDTEAPLDGTSRKETQSFGVSTADAAPKGAATNG